MKDTCEAKWKLLIDIPSGWARLKLAELTSANVIIATHNLCPEYLLDIEEQGAVIVPKVFPLGEMAIEVRNIIEGDFNPLCPCTTLSKAERQTLYLCASGLSRKGAAKERGVSPETIKSTLRPIFLKLNLTNHKDLVNYYFGLWHNIANWEPPQHARLNITHRG